MAKESMKARERKRQQLQIKYHNKRENLKKKYKLSRTLGEKLELQKQWQRLPRNSASIRIRNRCWLTGRSRGYYRIFGLSRHVLREMAHDCLLPGVRKSSW